LRGVAVTAVLFCHFVVPEISDLSGALHEALPAFLVAAMRHGDLGVEIFFVLSGFVIAFSVHRNTITPAFAGRFVLRRALRLDPPYYIALLVMLSVVAMDHWDGLAGAWRQFGGWPVAGANMFYLHDLLGYPTPLDISWSLCLEIQFYLAFILVCGISGLVFRGGSAGHDHLRLVLVGALVVFSLVSWFPEAHRFDFAGTWFRFGLGVITCWVFLGRAAAGWLYLLLVVILGAALWCGDPRGVAAVVTAGAIHLGGRQKKLGTWLSGRVVQFLGRISYSMYLLHLFAGIFLVNLLWKFLPQTPVCAVLLIPVGVAGALAGSWVFYLLLERPSMAVSQRVRKE
jgi:peptidoglycan/LPS O-acetylase OafA/YrhL